MTQEEEQKNNTYLNLKTESDNYERDLNMSTKMK